MARPGWMTVWALVFALVAAPVFAQGGTSATLTGFVQDKDGNVPGATVVVKNVATGEQLSPQVTNASGQYSFPGLAPGEYLVTITMSGFKKVELTARVQAGSSNNFTTKLEVGAITDVMNIRGVSDILRTETPAVTQTINADFIQTLPRLDRNALSFLIFLPGVQMVGGAANDGARFNTSVMGLSGRAINITIDGTTNSNLLQAGDSFFSMVVPRLDAVEEVTLTTAGAGADASGQGAIQIRFVTRSGTNQFQASLYWFQQHANLNSNNYFNRLAGLPVPQATNYTFGGRIGGPIILPGFDGRGRAFFFFNQEELYNPFENRRTRTMIRQSALDGNYTYGPTGATQTVNVMTLLQTVNGGQFAAISQYDPTVKSLLESMRAAAGTTGTITELVTAPNTATYEYLSPTKTINHAPTTNVTFNLTPKHRLQGSYYWLRFKRDPDALNTGDPTYPGFPAFGNASQYRTTASISLRSTLSTSIVNEMRGGWQWSPVGFFTNANPAMFDNQGGYNLSLGFGLSGAAPGGAQGPSERNTANWTIADQVNWLKGAHSFTIGGDFTRVDDYGATLPNNAPNLALGFTQNFDPTDGVFSATNFPGSTSAERNNARALYATLTGRVSSITGTGRLNAAGDEYVYNGELQRRTHQDDYSFYVQDVWRWKPTVTITAGLRYQYTLPVIAKTGAFTYMTAEDACGESGFGTGPGGQFCNMFNPGSILNPGITMEYDKYSTDTKGYDTDFNNFAPNIGVSWRPNVQGGFMRTILGDPELATVSAGYTRSYNRERTEAYLNVYSGNPGQTIPASRSTAVGAFPIVLPGETWPILYSQKSRLGAPGFNPDPIFPVPASFASGAWIFDPAIETPFTDSWNVSFQRSLTKDTVVEIRYQGNLSQKSWAIENWNAVNVYETGWLTGRNGVGLPNGEFEKAQANLRANVVAGRGPSMAYFGPGTDTVPLPIMLAHLNGSTAANTPRASAGCTSGPYCGTLWTNTTFTGALDPFFPNPYGFASNLYLSTSSSVPAGLSTRLFNNALAAGYPSNFWALNPLLGGVNITKSTDNRPENHFVTLQMRRRLAGGLAAQVAYTWQRSFSGQLNDFHIPRFYLRSTGIPHAIQALFTYDMPVGRGKRYGTNMNQVLDAVVGGWSLSGTMRFQRQSFVLRNAQLVGMTIEEARSALSTIRFVTDPVTGAQTIFNFPEDIYTNTRLAYATDEAYPTYYVPGTEPTGPLAMVGPNGEYRYFLPSGGPGCNWLYPGDCGSQELWFNGRWFGEMDFRLAKAFQLPGRARFEFSAEVFNATKALNFPNVINPSTSGNAFRITSTQSGARTAQVVWRVSW